MDKTVNSLIKQNDQTVDLTTEQGVVSYMKQASSEADWNCRCDDVKAANGGYPNFWFAAIILSGVASATLSGK